MTRPWKFRLPLTIQRLPFQFVRVGAPALLCLTASCAESTTSGEISITAEERPDVDRAMVDRGTLILPGGHGFNIKVFTSQQTGDGRGECAAQGGDGVTCRVVSGEKGTARADFQLGFAFDNTAEKPLDAEIRVQLEFTESIIESAALTTTAPASKLDSLGHSGLTLLIRDTNGATIRSEAINANHPIHGLRGSKSTHDQTFDARFEPLLGYYIFISGHIDAAATAANRAEVKLEVSKYAVQIQWRPAEGNRRTALDGDSNQARGTDLAGSAPGGAHGVADSTDAPQP